LAVKNNLFVLLDEAYYDVRYDGESTSLIIEPGMEERSVILYTFSKRYAMTGWRIGAALGPKKIIDVITKLNVNDESCTNHFTQYAALEALTGDQQGAQDILDTLKKRRDLCVNLLNDIEGIFCYSPNATFYVYPDVTEVMKNKEFRDYQSFLTAVLKNTGVSMCARAHFCSPLPGETREHMRLAYSGINFNAINEGLVNLKQYLEG
jgi:aspartate/methionine/tyrosine aminotransferase